MKLEWHESHLKLLQKIKIPFDVTADLTSDQICDLDEYVSDFMVMNYIDENDKLFGDGLLCEDMLYIINRD